MSTFTQTLTSGTNVCSWNRNPGDFGTGQIWTGKSVGGNVYDSCIHFTDVDIPPYADINAATLTINYLWGGNGEIAVIKGEDAANPTVPSSAADGVSRTRLATSVNGSSPGIGDQDFNVKTIIESILALAGWSSGNDMNIFMDDNGSDASYYQRSNSYNISIEIDYEVDIDFAVGSGNVNVSGSDVGIICSRELPLGSGSVAVTGSDLEWFIDRVFSLSPGSVIISGSEMTFSFVNVYTEPLQLPLIGVRNHPGIICMGTDTVLPVKSVQENYSVSVINEFMRDKQYGYAGVKYEGRIPRVRKTITFTRQRRPGWINPTKDRGWTQ
jgi:hypothetical protein